MNDSMDQDPALDVTLSDGRQVATFQIAALAGVREAWAIVEPRMPRRVIRGGADALAARECLADARPATIPRLPAFRSIAQVARRAPWSNGTLSPARTVVGRRRGKANGRWMSIPKSTSR